MGDASSGSETRSENPEEFSHEIREDMREIKGDVKASNESIRDLKESVVAIRGEFSKVTASSNYIGLLIAILIAIIKGFYFAVRTLIERFQ